MSYPDKLKNMQHCLVDRLDAFEFHDAELSLILGDNNRLIVSAKYLNIHKDAAPNNPETDMEIAEARVTFGGLRIIEFEPSRTWKKDENGNSYSDEPLVIHTDSVAKDMFENELRNKIIVLRMDTDNGICELLACGIDPCFSVRFDFASVRVEWNDYRGKHGTRRENNDHAKNPKTVRSPYL